MELHVGKCRVGRKNGCSVCRHASLYLFLSILISAATTYSYGSTIQMPSSNANIPAIDNSFEEHSGAAAALAAALASAAAVASEGNDLPLSITAAASKAEGIIEENDIKKEEAHIVLPPIATNSNNNGGEKVGVVEQQQYQQQDDTVAVTEQAEEEDDGYVYLPTKEHAEYPIEGFSRDSLVAGGVEMPQIYFTSPNEGEILKSSDVTVGLAIEPEQANLKERNILMCLELLFRHDTRSMNIVVDVKPAKVGITFPRREEHLSIQYVGIAVRLYGFEKDDGIVCMTISKDIHLNDQGMVTRVGESTDQCLKPTRNEIVISTDFPEGLNGVSAQLYSLDGKPLGKRGTMTQTWFRVTPSTSLPRPKMGLLTYWDSCMEEDPKTGAPLTPEIAGNFLPEIDNTDQYPVVHIGVLSARSYDRYDEAMVMIKSILFNRKRPNVLHFHLIVDPAGRIFFTENFVALKLPGLRISFYDFQQVCVKPNERLLKKFNFTQSAHYSGHAGYCRLYMYRYLNNIPDVDGLIAVESDQIFLEDVVELWEEFNNFPTNAMIGMPEIYKPWGAGRNKPTENDLTDGKINGVVNQNPDRDGWQSLVEKSISEYIKMKADLDLEVESWNPQMNDQDIFNSIFSLNPELVYALPCQYNIQFHAFQEHLRMCGMDNTNNIECDEAKNTGMFLCKRRPAIIHFMAQSYRDQGQMGKSYYSGFWQAMKQLNPDMLKYDFLENMCVK
eukprot:g8167.t1